MRWPAIIIGVVFLLTLASAGYRSQRTSGHGMAPGNCGNCHADVPPADHTAAFIKTEHAPRARTNRSACTSCHRDQRKECDACHQAEHPKWHTKAVREPGAGARQRTEHREAAAKHDAVCAECHAPAFQRQCASCHRADERWLLVRPGGAR